MKIYKPNIDSRSAAASQLLLGNPVGTTITFADRNVDIEIADGANCCNNCIFIADRNNHVRCNRFNCCAEHKRPDHTSVCFVDPDEQERLHKIEKEKAKERYVHSKKEHEESSR